MYGINVVCVFLFFQLVTLLRGKSMKKTVIIIALLAFAATQVFAADFVPTPMAISAPAQVLYNFDGSEVEIDVSISGTPALAYLLVYTKDMGASISKVQNGYLGWHYVNKIDTCIYASEASQLSVGSHTMNWDGTDNDGNAVEAGEYTYYIWGFDNLTFKIPLSRQFTPKPWGRIKVVQHGEDGMPLTQPWVLDLPAAEAEPMKSGSTTRQNGLLVVILMMPLFWRPVSSMVILMQVKPHCYLETIQNSLQPVSITTAGIRFLRMNGFPMVLRYCRLTGVRTAFSFST
jgi:hypothetical protein